MVTVNVTNDVTARLALLPRVRVKVAPAEARMRGFASDDRFVEGCGRWLAAGELAALIVLDPGQHATLVFPLSAAGEAPVFPVEESGWYMLRFLLRSERPDWLFLWHRGILGSAWAAALVDLALSARQPCCGADPEQIGIPPPASPVAVQFVDVIRFIGATVPVPIPAERSDGPDGEDWAVSNEVPVWVDVVSR